MLLGGGFGVMLGVEMVRMGDMRMMSRILMLFIFGVLHRLMMMVRGLLVVLGGVLVMFDGGVMLAHGRLLLAPNGSGRQALEPRHVALITQG
jgi:hypothetical protein